MPTELQKRLVQELPKHSFKVEPSMKSAGYNNTTSGAHQKRTIQQRGVQELLAKGGFNLTESDLIKEYEWIAKQRRDTSNKRIVIEKLIVHKNKELDFRDKQGNQGNVYNTQVNILSSEQRQAKIAELEQSLLSKAN